jgi:hypothetical protein
MTLRRSIGTLEGYILPEFREILLIREAVLRHPGISRVQKKLQPREKIRGADTTVGAKNGQKINHPSRFQFSRVLPRKGGFPRSRNNSIWPILAKSAIRTAI